MRNTATILLSSLPFLFSHSLAHANHASTLSPGPTTPTNSPHHSPPPPGPRLHVNPPRQRGLVCRSDTFDDILPRSNLTTLIESIVFVPAGSSYAEPPLQNPAYPIAPSNLPELCALTVRISTSPTSFFRFGLFLPTQWNSRFLALGNGGFAGGINWLDMGSAVRLPYHSAGGSFFATMSTDTGHNSTSGDVRWALGSPEKQKDFGYRAMHGAVEAAKKLVFAYYSGPPRRSYYAGCSTGGRQGLKEVQVSQDSKEKVFDGVLVGAPAWWSTNLATWTTKVFTYNNRDGAGKGDGHIPVGLMGAMLAKEVMRQCDGVDGVVDGIISAGDKCKLDWDKILCRTAGAQDNRTQKCLSSEQVKTAKVVYADYVVDGQFIFPGLSVGSEDLWPVLLGQAAPDPRGQEYVKMFILNDPDWDWRTYNDSIAKIAAAMDPGDLTADGFDISKYRDRGGKIIMYHGDADGLIPVKSSDYYYNKTAAVMGGMPSLQSWFRYFRVPGLGHCSGSAVNAPWYFAGANQAGSLPGTGTSAAVTGLADAQHDALLALVEWVENGREVDSIIATTWNKPSDPSSGILRQRPLCPYPKSQVLRSGADEKLAGSWICV